MASLRNIVVTTTGGGAITQAAGGIVQGVSGATATFTAGANPITLISAANDFLGVVTLSNSGANDVGIVDGNSITLGTLTIGRDLAVGATSGITTTGSIVSSAPGNLLLYSVAGDLTLGQATTYSAQNIVMSTGGNMVNNTANSSPFTNQNGGRTLVFSTNPNDNQPTDTNGGFSGFGVVYNSTLADLASLPAGNLMVYSDPQPINTADASTLNQLVQLATYQATVPILGYSLPGIYTGQIRLGYKSPSPVVQNSVGGPGPAKPNSAADHPGRMKVGEVNRAVPADPMAENKSGCSAPGRLRVSQLVKSRTPKVEVGSAESPLAKPAVRVGNVSLRVSGEFYPFELAEVTIGSAKVSQSR